MGNNSLENGADNENWICFCFYTLWADYLFGNVSARSELGDIFEWVRKHKKNRKCFSLQVSITQRCISVSFSSHLSLALELALLFPNICSQIFYFFYLSWWNLSYKIECNEIINGNFSLGHVLYIQCSLQNVCVLFQCNACLHSSFFSTKSY